MIEAIVYKHKNFALKRWTEINAGRNWHALASILWISKKKIHSKALKDQLTADALNNAMHFTFFYFPHMLIQSLLKKKQKKCKT